MQHSITREHSSGTERCIKRYFWRKNETTAKNIPAHRILMCSMLIPSNPRILSFWNVLLIMQLYLIFYHLILLFYPALFAIKLFALLIILTWNKTCVDKHSWLMIKFETERDVVPPESRCGTSSTTADCSIHSSSFSFFCSCCPILCDSISSHELELDMKMLGGQKYVLFGLVEIRVIESSDRFPDTLNSLQTLSSRSHVCLVLMSHVLLPYSSCHLSWKLIFSKSRHSFP